MTAEPCCDQCGTVTRGGPHYVTVDGEEQVLCAGCCPSCRDETRRLAAALGASRVVHGVKVPR